VCAWTPSSDFLSLLDPGDLWHYCLPAVDFQVYKSSLDLLEKPQILLSVCLLDISFLKIFLMVKYS
jgi:hypothetical protein